MHILAVTVGGHRKACPPSPADAAPALPEERQRKAAQGVSQTSKTHAQPTPRAETFLKSDMLPHRETFFLFHRARRIFFLMSQKENGGCIPAGKAGVVPHPWRENPRAGVSAPQGGTPFKRDAPARSSPPAGSRSPHRRAPPGACTGPRRRFPQPPRPGTSQRSSSRSR